MGLFYLYACADIYGHKLNFELAFNGPPSVDDLTDRVNEVFSSAMQEHSGRATDRFDVHNIAGYKKAKQQWVDIHEAHQITEMMQLYCFQENFQQDVTGALPRPLLPPACRRPQKSAAKIYTLSPERGGSVSPPRSYQPPPPPAPRELAYCPPQPQQQQQQPPPTDITARRRRAGSERSQAMDLFQWLDTNRDGLVSLSELRDAMLRGRIDISERMVGDTFAYGDRAVTASEFMGFGKHHPEAVQQLLGYARECDARELRRDQQQRPPGPSVRPQPASLNSGSFSGSGYYGGANTTVVSPPTARPYQMQQQQQQEVSAIAPTTTTPATAARTLTYGGGQMSPAIGGGGRAYSSAGTGLNRTTSRWANEESALNTSRTNDPAFGQRTTSVVTPSPALQDSGVYGQQQQPQLQSLQAEPSGQYTPLTASGRFPKGSGFGDQAANNNDLGGNDDDDEEAELLRKLEAVRRRKRQTVA